MLRMKLFSGNSNPALAQSVASYLGLPDPILGHPGFMADAGHPDDRGYAAIATALRPRLAPFVPN